MEGFNDHCMTWRGMSGHWLLLLCPVVLLLYLLVVLLRGLQCLLLELRLLGLLLQHLILRRLHLRWGLLLLLGWLSRLLRVRKSLRTVDRRR